MDYSDLPRETLEQMLRQRDEELKHEIEEQIIMAQRLRNQTSALSHAVKLIAFLVKENYND